MTDTLPVRLYDTNIGTLERTTRGGAVLRWSREAIDRWGENSRVLSAGLRVGVDDEQTSEAFFGGLLPEGEHIARLALAYRPGGAARSPNERGLANAVGVCHCGIKCRDHLRHRPGVVGATPRQLRVEHVIDRRVSGRIRRAPNLAHKVGRGADPRTRVLARTVHRTLEGVVINQG